MRKRRLRCEAGTCGPGRRRNGFQGTVVKALDEIVPLLNATQVIMMLLQKTAGHVVLIGDQCKFLTLLIAPNENGVVPTADQVESALQTYNQNYAKSRAQRVQKAHVLDKPFDVSTGELTATLKVKRAFLCKKYSSEICAMHEEGCSIVGYSSMNLGKFMA